jgi:excisionase family DNA binding protein
VAEGKVAPRWHDVPAAAEDLGLDRTTVSRMCQARQIRHRRIGPGSGRIVFDRADLDAYLASCVVEVDLPEEEEPVRFRHLRPPGRARRA